MRSIISKRIVKLLTFAAMKKILPIILITAFFIQGTSQLWIWTSFKINQDFIAANLCTNRFDAIPVCKGSCFLEKQLKKDQEQQQKSPELKLKEITVFCQDNTIGLPEQILFTTRSISYPIFTDFITSGYLTSTFHPPTSLG